MDYHVFSKKITLLAPTLVFLFMSGCGQENELGNFPHILDVEVENFIAIDGLIHSEPGILSGIDLRQFVVGGDHIKFTDVVSLSPGCAKAKLSEIGFDVYPEKGGLCHYRYTATLGDKDSQAIISVLGTQSRTPLLPTSSYSIPAEQESSSIHLPALLDVNFPSGYTLSNIERLDSNGGMNGKFAIDSTENSIHYTRNVSEFGWDRIRYTLIGRINVNGVVEGTTTEVEDTRIGEIYILSSRTDSGSVAPTIGNPVVSYPQLPTVIKAKESTVIDLTMAGIQINETNESDYQLIDVQSLSATVSAKDPLDVTNKSFNFQAAIPGEHVVSYIVSNHYGEYSMGLIRVQVIALQTGKTFPDIDVTEDTKDQKSSNYTLTAPPLYESSIANVFNVKPLWDYATSSTFAGFTNLESALSYCRTLGGDVPVLTEHLSSVITDAINSTTTVSWPASLGDYAHINSSGWSNGLLVACAKSSSMKWNMLATELYASDTFQDVGVLTKDAASQDVGAELIEIEGISETDIQFQLISAQNSRQVLVQAKSTKQGTFAVRLADKSNQAMFINSSEMTFDIPKCTKYDESLSSSCLFVDVFDSTKQFFASPVEALPSKPHLIAMPASTEALTVLGYKLDSTTGNTDKSYAGVMSKGSLFSADGQGSGGQAARWCDNLSRIAFMGRRDWLMPFFGTNPEHPEVIDDRYVRFTNYINVKYGFQYAGTWLDQSSSHNSLFIGSQFAITPTNTPLLVFCLAPLDVERLNLKVIANNATADGNQENIVEVGLYHSNSEPAAGIYIDVNVNNGAKTDSTSILTNSAGNANIKLTNTVKGIVTVTATYRDKSSVDVNDKVITNAVNVEFN